jgi:flavodoxin
MLIDYSKLKPLDYILITSRLPISCIIRKKTSGVWFDQSIASHCGILIDIDGKLFIAEMLSSGLEINSMKKYLDPIFWNGYQHIVEIKRNPIYNDIVINWKTQKAIVSDYFETLKYDFKGVLSYLFPDHISQDPKRYYCSEYIEKYAIIDGNPITSSIKCTPYDIQISPRIENVKEWEIK